ncbi:MAG: hypothetical protein ACE5GM_04560 [bacterium]
MKTRATRLRVIGILVAGFLLLLGKGSASAKEHAGMRKIDEQKAVKIKATHGALLLREGSVDTRKIDEDTQDYITHQHFHNYILNEVPVDQNPPFCYYCHGSYPHSNAKMTRSILNMHTIYLACESCHVRYSKRERARIGFRWFDGNVHTIQGDKRHYGTDYNPVSGRVLMEAGLIESKITPFKEWEGKYYMVNLRMDSPEASRYREQHRSLSAEQQSAIKSSIHANIETKGRECQECHSKNSLIPWRKLGFDPERIKDVTGLNIVGMVEKYQKFYIPNLFKQQMTFDAPIESIDEK